MELFKRVNLNPLSRKMINKQTKAFIDKRILLLQTDRLIKGSKLTSQNGFETE